MKKANNVLIFTQIPDPHTDDIVSEFAIRGYDVIRLNTNEIPEEIRLMFSPSDNKGSMRILSNGRTIRSDDIGSVWVRRPGYFGIPKDLTQQQKYFAVEEIRQALFGLLYSIDCNWVSHPNAIKSASWKPEQLSRAKKLGFRVPRTIITSDIEQITNYFDFTRTQVVYKLLSSPKLGIEKLIDFDPDSDFIALNTATKLVNIDEIRKLDSLHLTPSLFQEYIKKQYEYRVTIINNSCFAVKIDASKLPDAVDWREYITSSDLKLSLISLNKDVEQACLSITRSYGLKYATIDLVETVTGEIIFLEINPNGQFRYLEILLPDLKISHSLCNYLLYGCENE
jgi:glutathione synthase/RimK-type ligase-like ATP-grasp enzyme